jgi:NAD(P)-dependent dehydrogenase (short-subunit alcohol dehydrogenase family)
MTCYPGMTVRKENGMNIANKTILNTGANRGIGRALVNETFRQGEERLCGYSRRPAKCR